MKYLFFVILVVLCIAAAGTQLSMPDTTSDVPVIYWVTDNNPARAEQVAMFEQWLIDHGHVNDKGEPICRLRLDTANRDPTKQIIQGVSGVLGDLYDIGSGAGLQQFHKLGLVTDVTAAAKPMGFDPSHTYPAIGPEITIDGKQYMFPCNVAVGEYWINEGVIKKFHQPLPPEHWSLDEFEKLGKQYVKAANAAGGYQQRFYAASIDRQSLYRSLGLSKFNETLTRCTLDDARYAQILKRIYKWVYVDHIMPTQAEIDSATTGSGYGGAIPQLFATGRVAMLISGRYMLIQFRKFSRNRVEHGQPPLDLGVTRLPNGGYPNDLARTRAAGIYTGSKHKKDAELFLSYLASKKYNMQIIRDADALPPNPKYTDTLAFHKPLPLLPGIPYTFEQMMGYGEADQDAVAAYRQQYYAATDQMDRSLSIDEMAKKLPMPPKAKNMSDAEYQRRLAEFIDYFKSMVPAYQEEWGLHEKFDRTIREIGIADSNSPFILAATVTRLEKDAYDAFMNHLISADQAGRQAADNINAEMRRTIAANPKLQTQYDQWSALQKKIDEYRAAGRPVPVEWIKNPFYRRYYKDMGWLAQTD